MRNDFSQQFNGVLEMAQAEADRFNSPMIVSEHFLLGSLRDRNSTVFKIMSQLNIDTNKMESHKSSPFRRGNHSFRETI